MSRTKLPSYVELFHFADKVPHTKDIERAVHESMTQFFIDPSFGDETPSTSNLMLHYRYAVDTAVVDFALRKCNGSQADTALMLEISRGALRDLLVRLNIDPWKYR